MLTKKALEVSAGTVEDLAAEAGVGAHTLWSWASGRRNPSPENLERLAEALERRGGELARLAAKIRRAADQ